jgi:hypothetical protein
MKRHKQQEKLHELINDLERELAEGKNQVGALEEVQERLRATEQICQELADENRRLGAEITNWQNRFAASEQNQKQVIILRQQLDALQAEHARVTDRNREIQERLNARGEAGNISSLVKEGSAEAMIRQTQRNTVEGLSDLSGSGKAHGHLLAGSSDSAFHGYVANVTKASRAAWRFIVQNWHFGAVLAGIIIFVIAGAVSIKMLRTSRRPIAAPETAPVEQVAKFASRSSAERVQGTFQTVRPTQVFSEPSENSALVAEIGKGTRLNVVDSMDGWLEVRSKHGRPPGFIRQETAVRIPSN